jgi:hypothetical protein
MSVRVFVTSLCVGFAISAGAASAWAAAAPGAATAPPPTSPCYNDAKSATPTSRYVLNGDEAQDKQTGLTWQRCSVGQSFKDGACTGDIKTFPWDKAMREARGGWRVPTRDELETLVTKTCLAPALNAEVFPSMDVTKLSYWTSSAPDSGLAWLVYFDGGSDFNGLRTSDNPVRLVKGGKGK